MSASACAAPKIRNQNLSLPGQTKAALRFVFSLGYLLLQEGPLILLPENEHAVYARGSGHATAILAAIASPHVLMGESPPRSQRALVRRTGMKTGLTQHKNRMAPSGGRPRWMGASIGGRRPSCRHPPRHVHTTTSLFFSPPAPLSLSTRNAECSRLRFRTGHPPARSQMPGGTGCSLAARAQNLPTTWQWLSC